MVAGWDFQKLDDHLYERHLFGQEQYMCVLEIVHDQHWNEDIKDWETLWIWGVDHWSEPAGGTVHRDESRIWFNTPEDALTDFRNVWVSYVIEEGPV